MTGCAIITDAITVVVAEGGPKAQKRYKKLLLDRIKWDAVPDDDEDEAVTAARCVSSFRTSCTHATCMCQHAISLCHDLAGTLMHCVC